MSHKWFETFMDICHCLSKYFSKIHDSTDVKRKYDSFVSFTGLSAHENDIYDQLKMFLTKNQNDAKMGIMIRGNRGVTSPGDIFKKDLILSIEGETATYDINFCEIFKHLATEKKLVDKIEPKRIWACLTSKFTKIFMIIVPQMTTEIPKNIRDLICANTVEIEIDTPFSNRSADKVRKLLGSIMEHPIVKNVVDEQIGKGKTEQLVKLVKDGNVDFDTGNIVVSANKALEEGSVGPLEEVFKNLVGNTIGKFTSSVEKDVDPNEQE